MRDIRNDLQERARFIEDELVAIQAQFDKVVEQLKAERDTRLAALKGEFVALSKLMEAEHRRMADALPLQAPQPQPQPQPQVSLADFIMQSLTEMGPMSKEALVNHALREGLFADVDSADRAVHGTLIHIIRSEHLRQQHDGTFVANTPPQALRLRRA